MFFCCCVLSGCGERKAALGRDLESAELIGAWRLARSGTYALALRDRAAIKLELSPDGAATARGFPIFLETASTNRIRQVDFFGKWGVRNFRSHSPSPEAWLSLSSSETEGVGVIEVNMAVYHSRRGLVLKYYPDAARAAIVFAKEK